MFFGIAKHAPLTTHDRAEGVKARRHRRKRRFLAMDCVKAKALADDLVEPERSVHAI